ncbi:hypothetical protein IWW34DRAFT_638033 [Fusarium oxysporum f. sp. albedinis]|nr:hypothetical protein IWW34DRAFT_638033 [Fusarium oxysporum f. sp. albedinis]
MTKSVAIEHHDAQKKLTHRARNRDAQARHRSASKANEEILTVLRWGLREIASATCEGDLIRSHRLCVWRCCARLCGYENGSVLSFQKVVPYYLVTKRGGGIRTLLPEQA